MAWFKSYLPRECPICGLEIVEYERDGINYSFHPECYWREWKPGSSPVYVTSRKVRTRVLKTPMLACLQRNEKIELTDGCSHQCIYCYSVSEPRFFPHGFVIKRENLIEKVEGELRRRRVVRPIYLCPNCEPFPKQLPEVRTMTTQLIELLVDNNLSFYFVMKGVLPRKALDKLSNYPQADVQVSLTTLNEEKRKLIEPNAPSVSERLKNLERLVEIGINPILRVDPLLPYLTDDDEELEDLIGTTIGLGIRHVVGSYVGIRPSILKYMSKCFLKAGLKGLPKRYRRLLKKGPKVCKFDLVSERYRYRKLKLLSQLVRSIGNKSVTFSTCLEDRPGKELFRGLWTSKMCEPIYLPAVVRTKKGFKPVEECRSCNLRGCKGCQHLKPKKRTLELSGI